MKRIEGFSAEGRRNAKSRFQPVCPADELKPGQAKKFTIPGENGKTDIALFNIDGKFYAISENCQHKGGPLSQGILKGDKVTCPWHGWTYSVVDGKSPHKGGDSVNSYETKVMRNKVHVDPIPAKKGELTSKPHHAYAELQNDVAQFVSNMDSSALPVSEEKKTRVLGISTTNANDKVAPRKSTSEAALAQALDYARKELDSETVMIKLRDLNFKHCEGYYSKDAQACIFPCSISEMDEKDQMIEIYRRVILWADVVVVSTPIRWGNASSLYYQMVQRMNCVQNQMVSNETFLIRDKVGAFIITGGQDNVQHVAGELLSFWSQLGFVFGKFPFTGWTRGWYAEDTENNYSRMNESKHLKQDLERMMRGATEMSRLVRKNRYDSQIIKAKVSTEA